MPQSPIDLVPGSSGLPDARPPTAQFSPQISKHYDLDLRDYAYIILKRKAIIITTALLTGLFSFIFASTKMPVYTATSAVKIEENPTAQGVFSGYYSYDPFSTTTEMQIIKSYPVVERISKELGFIDEDLTSEQIKNSDEMLGTIMSIQGMLETTQEEGTTIINISATSPDSEFVKRLANVAAQKYKTYSRYLRTKQQRDTIKLIHEKIETTESILAQNEEQLKEFMRAHKIVALADEKTIASGQLRTVEQEVETVLKRKMEVEALIGNLRQKDIKQSDDRPLADSSNDAYNSLNNQLLELLLKKKDLPLDYTELHPEVRKINKQITDIQKMMLNELYNEYNTIQVREVTLKKRLDEVSSQNQELPDIERKLLRLDREIRINEDLLAMLKSKYQETQIQESQEVGEVDIVRLATQPAASNTGGKLPTVFVGILIGLMFGVVLAIIRETLDTSIGTIEDVEEFLGIPVLGLIPHMDQDRMRFSYDTPELKQEHEEHEAAKKKDDWRDIHLITQFEPKSTIAESYRALRTNIQFANVKKGGKVFLMCSPYMKEGKTTTTSNLAITIAQDGNKVLLIDCDLRKSTVHRTFGLMVRNGVADIILGKIHWKEAIKDITDLMIGSMKMDDIMMTPGLENLHIITSGGYPPNPSELLNSQEFVNFLKEARQEYDIIIIDSPPIIAVSDSAIIAPHVDATIIVHKQGMVPRKILKRAKMTLDNVQGKVTGIVLNDVSAKIYPEYAKFQIQYYGHDQKEEPKWLDHLKDKFNFIPYYGKLRRRLDKPVWQITLAAISVMFIVIGLIYQTKLY